MKRVLVVEDNDDLRELTRVILERHGYVVDEAENGAEALARLSAMKPAPCLVLLDLMMPVMDGRQLLERLQRDQMLATLPVVVVSAAANEPIAGAKKTVKKPVSAETLVRVVERFCPN